MSDLVWCMYNVTAPALRFLRRGVGLLPIGPAIAAAIRSEIDTGKIPYRSAEFYANTILFNQIQLDQIQLIQMSVYLAIKGQIDE